MARFPPTWPALARFSEPSWRRCWACIRDRLNVQVPQLPPGPDHGAGDHGLRHAASANEQRRDGYRSKPTAPEFFYFVHTASGQNPIAAINALRRGGGRAGAGSGQYLYARATRRSAHVVRDRLRGHGRRLRSWRITQRGGAGDGAGEHYVRWSKVGGIGYFVCRRHQNAGLYQVNLRVPSQVADGDQSLTITIGGVASPAGGFITVQGGVSASAGSR